MLLSVSKPFGSELLHQPWVWPSDLLCPKGQKQMSHKQNWKWQSFGLPRLFFSKLWDFHVNKLAGGSKTCGSLTSLTQPKAKHQDAELWKWPAAVPRCLSKSSQHQKTYLPTQITNPHNHELNKCFSLSLRWSVLLRKLTDTTQESQVKMAALDGKSLV